MSLCRIRVRKQATQPPVKPAAHVDYVCFHWGGITCNAQHYATNLVSWSPPSQGGPNPKMPSHFKSVMFKFNSNENQRWLSIIQVAPANRSPKLHWVITLSIFGFNHPQIPNTTFTAMCACCKLNTHTHTFWWVIWCSVLSRVSRDGVLEKILKRCL